LIVVEIERGNLGLFRTRASPATLQSSPVIIRAAAMSGTEEHGWEIAAQAREWAVPCDDSQVRAVLTYFELLLTWSARINLTAASSVGTLVGTHLPDAFALASRLAEPETLVDVGSGGGLPALPLALLRPALTVELCEPIAKKGAFLRTAIRELGLDARVRLTAGRAEAIAASRAGAFDVAISRATFHPAEWVTLGLRLVRPGGRVFALLSGDALPEPRTGADPGQPRQQTWRRTYLSGRRSIVEFVSRETEPPPMERT
jgi:16S rRNA (guanine527-N7)-methyltransferase